MITNRAELIDVTADYLNRDDLTARIPTFIQLAESKLDRDERIRTVVGDVLFPITGVVVTMPVDFAAIQTWRHAGSTNFFGLRTRSLNDLARINDRRSDMPGTPAYVAFTKTQDGATLARFAPPPNATYEMLLSYWRRLTPRIGLGAVTNWLLEAQPDIYLHGTLIQAEPFLKHDERIQTWSTLYEDALNKMMDDTDRQLFSGQMAEGMGGNAGVIGG